MEEKLSSNVLQFPQRNRASVVDALNRVINEAIESTESASPIKKPPARKQSTGTAQAALVNKVQGIHGGTNIIGNHGPVTIHTAPAPRPRTIVQPGPQHINAAQAAEVRELVAKVVAKTGRDYSFVWSTVKRECRFSRYELITPETYEQVCKYLRQWIARHTTKPTRSTEEQRKHLLKRIYAEARKRRGVLDQIHTYASGQFGTNSLADLTPEQLHKVIQEFGL